MKKVIFLLLAMSLAVSSWADVIIIPSEDMNDVQVKEVDGDIFIKTIGDYRFTFKTNEGSSRPGYNKDGDLRIYAKCSMTITNIRGNKFTQLVFTISERGQERLAPITASVGNIAPQSVGDETVTWDGVASEVTFVVGDMAVYGSGGESKSGQFDFTKLVIVESEQAEVDEPDIFVADATVVGPQTVIISCRTQYADIFYTIDGSEPTERSDRYIDAFVVSKSCTVKAIAVYNGAMSKVASKEITIKGALGDVNKDGVVDVSDVVALANHVMGETPVEFDLSVSNINDDDVVDVSDVVALANKIMGD